MWNSLLSLSAALLQLIRRIDRGVLLALQERVLGQSLATIFPAVSSDTDKLPQYRLRASVLLLGDCFFGLLRDVFRAVAEPLPLFLRRLLYSRQALLDNNKRRAGYWLISAGFGLLLTVPARLLDMFLRCARCCTDIVDVLLNNAGMRQLQEDEKRLLQAIFGDSLIYSLIRIKCGCLSHRFLTAHAAGNVIYIPTIQSLFNTEGLSSHYLHREAKPADLMLSEAGRSLLVHEAAHVWQHHNGGSSYMHRALLVQLAAWLGGGSRSGAYDWRAGLDSGMSFGQLNPEQQAQLVQDNALELTNADARESSPNLELPAIVHQFLVGGTCY